MTRSRRTFTAQEKLTAVRRYLIDRVPVSDLCDELGLQPTHIYQWQKQLFENGESAFTKPNRKSKTGDAKDKIIEALESKIQLKNEVVAELLQEHVQLKKELGEP
ncbi:transposase [Novipirellula artificiosorum]|uniref:Transposase n=1 Tax=Novipirellula artificiosorum TaxID=2528016 RepID=A0A5C6DSP3_9BACT|nr:transposase [Novipirellula artificiosorum]TWU39750.1 Transposase [Novipirellula artificiosorum]